MELLVSFANIRTAVHLPVLSRASAIVRFTVHEVIIRPSSSMTLSRYLADAVLIMVDKYDS